MKSLQAVSKLGKGKDKDLLLELPNELARSLNIRADGGVDTRQLLDLFSAVLCQEESCKISSDDLVSLQERIEMMLNIYDSDRASD
ncbi:MAG: hypothetical protein Q7V63_01985 [Gammaproteobacteria bacterium]|nr:hypothetical protein [Gammaproteobacteria bacterium]